MATQETKTSQPASLIDMAPMIAGDAWLYESGVLMHRLAPQILGRKKADGLSIMHPELQWGYLTLDSRFYLEKIKQLLRPGGNNPKSRALEANCYSMAVQISQRDYNRWPIRTRDQMLLRRDDDNEGKPIALIDEKALSCEGNFIEALLTQRLQAHRQYQTIIEKLTSTDSPASPALEKFLKRARSILVPVFILDVPTKTKPIINPVTGLKENDWFQVFFRQALEEVDYWSASEHMIFIDSKNPSHNYPAYIRKEAERTGLPIEEILFRGNLHEFMHILADEVTNRRFNMYNTWLNEGFCEYFAQNMGAAEALTSVAVKKTKEEIMGTDEYEEKYIYGPRLVWAIGKAYNNENPDLGVWEFLVKMYGDGKPCEATLMQEANRILAQDGKTELVDRRL